VERPGDGLITGEVVDDVDDALARLSPKQRSAIVLTAVEGLSVSEAAKIENCLLPTMYWRIHHARKILKKLLAEHVNI